MDNLNYDHMLTQLSKYEVISFDVFDTLICRSVVKPTDVFKIVEAKAMLEGIISKPFFDDRVNAEQQSYKEVGEWATISRFYEVLHNNFGYTQAQCDWLMKTEFATEMEVVYPREDMLSILMELKKMGRRVLLCSDMYLSSGQIKNLLVKCGYPEDLELWVSCEKGVSKGNGKIWDALFNYLPDNISFIHVGDNEWSDYKTLDSINREALLIEKGLESFEKSEMYGYLSKYITDDNDINNSLVMGYLINVACFNSPFGNHMSEENVESIWMGYAFACFVNRISKNKDGSLLLFVTREGYLLKGMYERYCEACGISPQKNTLFYASRTATLAATVVSEQDLLDSFSSTYEGTLGHFLKHRLNYELSTENPYFNEKITLPEESKKVMQLLKSEIDSILENGREQREAYRKYIDFIRGRNTRKLTVVDVGYNGTIQYALSKILDEDVFGQYMYVNGKIVADKIGDRYTTLCDTFDGDFHPILENLLFMEAVMQVPFGQLQKMSFKDGKASPEFNADGNFSTHIPVAQEHFCQFVEWIGFWKTKLKEFMLLDFKLAEEIWICLLKFNFISEDLLNSFWLADDFAGHPVWKYDIEGQKWIGGYSEAPLSFNVVKNGESINFKYKLKNIVKKYIPVSAYEKARKIWVKYIK